MGHYTSRQHQNDTTHTAIPKQSMPLTRAVYRGGKRKKGRSLRLNTMWIELVRRDIKEHQTFGKTESLDESHIVVFFGKYVGILEILCSQLSLHKM